MTPADPRAAAMEKLLTDETLFSVWQEGQVYYAGDPMPQRLAGMRRTLIEALLALPVAETGWQNAAKTARELKDAAFSHGQSCGRAEILAELAEAARGPGRDGNIARMIERAFRAQPAPPEPPEGEKQP